MCESHPCFTLVWLRGAGRERRRNRTGNGLKKVGRPWLVLCCRCFLGLAVAGVGSVSCLPVILVSVGQQKAMCVLGDAVSQETAGKPWTVNWHCLPICFPDISSEMMLCLCLFSPGHQNHSGGICWNACLLFSVLSMGNTLQKCFMIHCYGF